MVNEQTERGKTSKIFVERWLDDLDYVEAKPSLFFHLRCLEQPMYARQCEIGNDIYGKARRVDFIVYHPEKWPDCLVIECKWQSSGGTTDEKFPFLVLSIQINEFQTIVVLDGGGYRQSAENWIKGQAGKNKLLHVYDMGDFARFASRGQL